MDLVDEEQGGFLKEAASFDVHKQRAFAWSFLIALIGTGAGCAFLGVGIRAARQDSQDDFNKQADEITQSVQTTWQEFAIASLWMHETCHGRQQSEIPSIGCTRKDFSDYFDYITSSQLNPELVIWVANVTHANRPAVEAESREYHLEMNPPAQYNGFIQAVFNPDVLQFEPVPREEAPWYFVEHYSLPATENAILFADHDISTNAFIMPIVEAALQDMEPKVTRRLPKKDEVSYFVQMYHPGIKRQQNPERNAVANVMIKVYNVLSRAIKSQSEELNVFVYDVTPIDIGKDGKPQFMSGARIVKGNETGSAILTETDFDDAVGDSPRVHKAEIAIEDRIWLVLVTDPDDIFKPIMFPPIVGGLAVVVASCVTACMFYSSTLRATELQKQQAQAEAEKARLLQRLNQDLSAQVEKRANELRDAERISEERRKEAELAEARSQNLVQAMSMLSHELRTPLQGIMGITSLALSEASTSQTTASFGECDDEYPDAPFTVPPLSTKESMITNLNTIHASSQQLLTLINNMLDVRKIGTGMMERVDVECIDMAPIVEQCVSMLASLSHLSDVVVHADREIFLKRSTWLARGAILPVQQVLINLVSNGIKYSSTSGKPSRLDVNIRRSNLIRARQEANEALCSSCRVPLPHSQDEHGRQVLIVDVRDRGSGIPIDEADKVFTAFAMLNQHVGQSKGFAQPSGSGLGLNLCASLMEMMNGCVWANNCTSPKAAAAMRAVDDSAGCVFSFYLECPSPVEVEAFLSTGKESKVMNCSILRDSLTSATAHESDGTGDLVLTHRSKVPPPSIARVLVVDDIKINAKVIVRLLSSLGYKHVRTTTTGEKALELLKEDPVCDWVITDYQMPPGMNGIELSGEIAALYSSHNFPGQKHKSRIPAPFVTLCTADYSSTLAVACKQVQVDAIIRKPVTLPELCRFIQNNCESPYHK